MAAGTPCETDCWNRKLRGDRCNEVWVECCCFDSLEAVSIWSIVGVWGEIIVFLYVLI